MHAPSDPGARRTRVTRGVLASSTATGAALVSHVAAGGSVPVPAVVLTVLVLGWLPGIALIGRRPSLAGQAAVIGPVEAVMHLAFAVPIVAPAGLAAAPSLHVHSTGSMGSLQAMPGMPTSPLMWAAHAGAALLTLLAWHSGERAFWGLVALAARGGRRLLGRFVVVRPLALPHPVVRVVRAVHPLPTGPVLAVAPRRGPPRPA